MTGSGSRLSGRVLFKDAHVCMNCMYGWIPFCNRIIENKRNKTKKKNYAHYLALNSGLYDGFLFYVIIYSPEV